MRMRSLAIVFVVAAALPAAATTVVYLDVDDLTERSNAVVRARVLERESRWDDEGRGIYTFTTVEVLSTLKGGGDETLVIRQLGGEVDGVGSLVAGDASFQVGEEVVVFLRRNPEDAVFHLVGLSQGKFSIDREGDQPLALRNLSDLSVGRFEDGKWVSVHGETSSIGLEELERAIADAVGE